MKKQKTDWERKLMTLMVITVADALFAGRSRPITKDCSDVTVKHHKKISKFISQLLKTQREEIIKEIEGIPAIYIGSHPIGIEEGPYLSKDKVLEVLKLKK